MRAKVYARIAKSTKYNTASITERLATRHRNKLNAAAGGSVVGGAFLGGSFAGFPGAVVGGLVGFGVAALAAKETKR